VKEAVLVASWPEFRLSQDVQFLPDILNMHQRKEGRGISHTEVIPASINRLYSLNRQYNNEHIFVIYTTLTVDQNTLDVSCLHGHAASQNTFSQTRCPTVGPPFELKSFFLVPSYGLVNSANNTVKIIVNLSCQGKSFSADVGPPQMWMNSAVRLTVFSFSQTHPAKEHSKRLNFWPDRDSSMSISLTIARSDLQNYIKHNEDGEQVMDLQMRFFDEENSDERVPECQSATSPPKIMRGPTRLRSPQPSTSHGRVRGVDQITPRYRNSQRTTYDARIDKYNSVGRAVNMIRRETWSPTFSDVEDVYGDVNRSPQSPWRSYRSPSFSPQRANNTIEVVSPEYVSHNEGYGNINRSPQCNHHESPDYSPPPPSYSPLSFSETSSPQHYIHHQSPGSPQAVYSPTRRLSDSPPLVEFEPIRSPASPPRNAVSPILFIKSPQYQPPAPSPPVIDIDIEEEEPARYGQN
jgi:hypothetical protein